MRINDLVLEGPQPNQTLYHGTCVKYLPLILDHGLMPTIGEFTQLAYDVLGYDDDELREEGFSHLVFAADKKGISSCYSAILGAIESTKGRDHRKVDDVLKYGALLIIKNRAQDFTHRPEGDEEWHPRQVEPGDYYSDNRIQITSVLTGKKLIQFLVKHGVLFWDTNHEISVRQIIGKAVKILMKHGRSQPEAMAEIKEKGINYGWKIISRYNAGIEFE